MKAKIRIGFLASHNGTAFRVLLERREEESLEFDPAVLITNNPDAPVLFVAAKYGVPSHVINSNTAGKKSVDEALCDCLIRHDTALVLLAGYMKKIGPKTLATFNNRIINSHPALLPKFGGQGMYGRRVHEAVIAAHEKASGVTIHFVDKEYDTGPIITQISIPLNQNETIETLEEKIKELEPNAYVQAIKIITTSSL